MLASAAAGAGVGGEVVQATAVEVVSEFGRFLKLLGPPEAAEAFDAKEQAANVWSSIQDFFFDPRLQWDENGKILLDPQGNPLPDNLWTQFVAVQATLIKRLDMAIASTGIPGSFGCAVACYTLLIRAVLYPFVKGQLETTAKMQVLKPRVEELKKLYAGKENEEKLQQEVGLLYMDLQIDPLGAILPLLLQLPVFWGLYRAIRRLAIVQYDHLKDGFLWIPSLYGPGFTPDPSLTWITSWQGPLIDLHPKIGWETFGLYAILPLAVFASYRTVLAEALEDKDSPKVLQIFPYMLAFICVELPQAMGIYIATNIASSVALTNYTKNQISSKIPGYDEFVKTGKWPAGVDAEKVLAKAFGVKRLTGDDTDFEDPASVPEAVFAGRADFIPELIKQGKDIDAYDDRGIQASAYTLALNSTDLLLRLFELGADPLKTDRRKNTLLHYCAGYGRALFFPVLLEKGCDSLMNAVNEDGQTALDVARMNLSQTKIADDVREMIKLMEGEGAEGKTTTKADEARFEEAREKKEREESLQAARSALMAFAAQSSSSSDNAAGPAAAEASAAAPSAAEAGRAPVAHSTAEASTAEEAGGVEQSAGSGVIAASLDRVKSLDLEALRERLGGKVSEEQLQKVAQRLAKLSPQELAVYASTGKVPVAAAAEADEPTAEDEAGEAAPAAPAAPAEEKTPQRRISVIVD